MGEEGKEPGNVVLEDKKGKKMTLLCLQKGRQLCLHLDFKPVRPISDF